MRLGRGHVVRGVGEQPGRSRLERDRDDERDPGRDPGREPGLTVQGDGTQSVSVLEGTYRATVVTMTMVSKVGSFTTTAVVKVWTAAGTGPVKTQQVVKAGGKTQLITTSELVFVTRQAAGS